LLKHAESALEGFSNWNLYCYMDS